MPSFSSVIGYIYETNTHFIPVLVVVGLALSVIRRLRNRANRPGGGRASAENQRISSVFQRKPGTTEELAARAEAESGHAEAGSERAQPIDKTGQRDL